LALRVRLRPAVRALLLGRARLLARSLMVASSGPPDERRQRARQRRALQPKPAAGRPTVRHRGPSAGVPRYPARRPGTQPLPQTANCRGPQPVAAPPLRCLRSRSRLRRPPSRHRPPTRHRGRTRHRRRTRRVNRTGPAPTSGSRRSSIVLGARPVCRTGIRRLPARTAMTGQAADLRARSSTGEIIWRVRAGRAGSHRHDRAGLAGRLAAPLPTMVSAAPASRTPMRPAPPASPTPKLLAARASPAGTGRPAPLSLIARSLPPASTRRRGRVHRPGSAGRRGPAGRASGHPPARDSGHPPARVSVRPRVAARAATSALLALARARSAVAPRLTRRRSPRSPRPGCRSGSRARPDQRVQRRCPPAGRSGSRSVATRGIRPASPPRPRIRQARPSSSGVRRPRLSHPRAARASNARQHGGKPGPA
jgi:hypothetical protein